MSCPTCNHTMHGVGDKWFWCPNCGTILNNGSDEHRERTTSIPSVVGQVINWLHNPRFIAKEHIESALGFALNNKRAKKS